MGSGLHLVCWLDFALGFLFFWVGVRAVEGLGPIGLVGFILVGAWGFVGFRDCCLWVYYFRDFLFYGVFDLICWV